MNKKLVISEAFELLAKTHLQPYCEALDYNVFPRFPLPDSSYRNEKKKSTGKRNVTFYIKST